MEKHRYFKVNTLSEEAQRMIRDGLERNRTIPTIGREMEQHTGERITRWALQRYAAWYRARKQQRQEIQDRVGAATETALRLGHEVTAGVQAELLDTVHQAAREGKLSELGPYSAGKLALAFAESTRKDRQLGHPAGEAGTGGPPGASAGAATGADWRKGATRAPVSGRRVRRSYLSSRCHSGDFWSRQ